MYKKIRFVDKASGYEVEDAVVFVTEQEWAQISPFLDDFTSGGRFIDNIPTAMQELVYDDLCYRARPETTYSVDADLLIEL